jgi:hypothetical protein
VPQPRPAGAVEGPDPTRRDVEELRADIGDTVEELVHRVDVPSRIRDKRAETTERVQAQVTHAREVVAEVVTEKGPALQNTLQNTLRDRPAVVGGVLAALLLLLVRNLRRRARRSIVGNEEDTGGTR